MMTTVDEDNNDITKVPDKFIYFFRKVLLFRFIAELDK